MSKRSVTLVVIGPTYNRAAQQFQSFQNVSDVTYVTQRAVYVLDHIAFPCYHLPPEGATLVHSSTKDH